MLICFYQICYVSECDGHIIVDADRCFRNVGKHFQTLIHVPGCYSIFICYSTYSTLKMNLIQQTCMSHIIQVISFYWLYFILTLSEPPV